MSGTLDDLTQNDSTTSTFCTYVHTQTHTQMRCTQNIENLWIRAKCKLKIQFGTTGGLSKNMCIVYLREFEYRSRVWNGNIFAQFIIVIGAQYISNVNSFAVA